MPLHSLERYGSECSDGIQLSTGRVFFTRFFSCFSCFFARAREDRLKSLYPCGFAAFLTLRELCLFCGLLCLFCGLSAFFAVLSTICHEKKKAEIPVSRQNRPISAIKIIRQINPEDGRNDKQNRFTAQRSRL